MHFDYWKHKLHINRWNFIIVHKTDGIIVRRIRNHNVEKGIIAQFIHSILLYPDKEISFNDVTKLFQAIQIQKRYKSKKVEEYKNIKH